jgi:hypothetical protein
MRLAWRKAETSDNPFLTLARLDPQHETWRDTYFIADFRELGSGGQLMVIGSLIVGAIFSLLIPLIDRGDRKSSLLSAAGWALFLMAISILTIDGYIGLWLNVRLRWITKRRWPIYAYFAALAIVIDIAIAKPKTADQILLPFIATSFIGGGPLYGAWRLLSSSARKLWRRLSQ